MSATARFLRPLLTNDSVDLTHLKQNVLNYLKTSNLVGKKWAFVGDSTSGYTDVSFSDVIAAQTGCTRRNLSASGWRMMRISGLTNCLLDKLTQLDGTEDYITILAGYNDRGTDETNGFVAGTQFSSGATLNVDESTFWGAYNKAMLTIFGRCPNARIGVMTILPNGTDRSSQVSLDVNAIIKACAAYFTVPVLDLYNEVQLPVQLAAINTAYTLNDRLHPNDAGHAIIARKIRPFLESL